MSKKVVKEKPYDEYKKNWIKEGMEVAHKEVPTLKMVVDRLLRENYSYPDPNNPEQKIEKSRIVGVKCRWWKDNDIRIHNFHTRELVPWDVADGANYVEIMKFLEREQS